jgi:hypothetical protein
VFLAKLKKTWIWVCFDPELLLIPKIEGTWLLSSKSLNPIFRLSGSKCDRCIEDTVKIGPAE